MTILVVGANGATGKHLVNQLLDAGHTVKAIVRPSGKIPEAWSSNKKLILIRAGIVEMGVDEMAGYLKDCRAVASCLGHNLTRKGIFGKPRRLVTDTVELICDAVKKNAPAEPIRFVLMNTVGNRNRDLQESVPFGERIISRLLRFLLPPFVDNEKAAGYLRVHIGKKNQLVEWVAVRPDSLIDEDEVTDYDVYVSPIRSALFNPGKTSRINVGHFMARLLTEDDEWMRWKGKMPVVYNREK